MILDTYIRCEGKELLFGGRMVSCYDMVVLNIVSGLQLCWL